LCPYLLYWCSNTIKINKVTQKKKKIETQFTCNSCPTANVWRKLIFCNKYLAMFWVQKRIKNIFLSQGGFHFVFLNSQLLWWGACNFCEIVIAQKQIRFRNEPFFFFNSLMKPKWRTWLGKLWLNCQPYSKELIN